MIDAVEKAHQIEDLGPAQNFYRKLGMYLSGRSSEHQTRGLRAAAKMARRVLEERFGEAVRLTSAVESSVETKMSGEEARKVGAVSGVRLPTWSMRSFMTLPKPKSINFPYIWYVVLDPVTREPITQTLSISDALLAAEQLATSRLRRKAYTSKAKALAAFYGALVPEMKTLLDQLREMTQVVEDRLSSMKAAQRKADEAMLLETSRAGGTRTGMGTAPD